MTRLFAQAALCVAAVLFSNQLFSQSTTIRGTIKDAATQVAVQSVSVVIAGTGEGTYTDEKGNFSLITNRKPPFTLEISAVGFESKSVSVSGGESLSINLTPSTALGQEVVVSATRTPSRILESPVTIERISSAAIRNTPAVSYYDILASLKGVGMVTASLTFKTPTTRGFGSSGNLRLNQIVDGMDNQAPGLNFSVGTIIGPTELDVDNVELLPGASSSLYGPGGMNGTLLINTKNPFKHQGLSFQVKTGLMHLDRSQRSISPFFNWSVRYGQKVGSRFAYKIGAELLQAKDWLANDDRNYSRNGALGAVKPGTRDTDPNYDGVNIYGDETTTNLRTVLNAVAGSFPPWAGYISTLPANIPVSRTGYTEKELADPNTVSAKFNAAVHYKLTNNIEAVLAGHVGFGTTVYTGSDRYSLKDFKIGQFKFELNSKNWNLRAYTTQENSGGSHNLTISTQLFNEAWRPSTQWYPAYAIAYMNAKLAGRPDIEAHNLARSTADVGRPAAGSPQFRQLFNQVIGQPIPIGGQFLDRSDLYHVEGQYNLSEVVKFAEVLVGGNFRRFVLNSQGTLFNDTKGNPIGINEFGAYIQIQKDIVKDRLRINASGRYDKNQNFDGRFTPRVTLLVKPAKNHNIRLSYQQAYRFPSTQNQWINLNVGGGARLMGAVKELWDQYNLTENPAYAAESLPAGQFTVVPFSQLKPEVVTSFEIGYKALIGSKLLIDAYYYNGNYENFISSRQVVQKRNPAGPNTDLFDASKRFGYSISINSTTKVQTFGWGASVDYLIGGGFAINANLSSDEIKDVPANFQSFFNAPKYRAVAGFSNSGFGKKKAYGFNVQWRWQDEFFYEGTFGQGQVAAFHTVDAQVSYRWVPQKIMLKLGANNLLNQYYTNGFGNANSGGLYYFSIAYNLQ
jgi:outer membrane receptor protein involved in Fe transport